MVSAAYCTIDCAWAMLHGKKALYRHLPLRLIRVPAASEIPLREASVVECARPLAEPPFRLNSSASKDVRLCPLFKEGLGRRIAGIEASP